MVANKEITLLYVDDEEINLFLFEKSFDSMYRVYTADSGFVGLEKLKAHQNEIIVVISDMRMPEMNGLQFISKARKQFNHIAYFILTGYDYNEEIDKALKTREVHRFFTKPFDVEDIKKAINEITLELGLI